MESGSSQEINSDESDRSFQIESFHEHDFGDDELSQSNSICIGEDGKKIELSFQSSPSVNNAVDPYIGMEFQSRDDAREHYITYGRRIGFTVRIHHNRRSRINNMVIGQDFVCSKEGFREKKYVYRKDRILPPPPITREGCPAMLRLTLKDGVKWVVTKFIEEHNHGLLSPSKVPWRGSTKNIINEDEKDRRIRELTLELYNERQRCKRQCAAYQEQLQMVLKEVEQYTGYLSKRVEEIVQNVRKLENEQTGDSDHR